MLANMKFLGLSPDLIRALNLGQHLGGAYTAEGAAAPKLVALAAFAALALILLRVGSRKEPVPDTGPGD
jgi:hypothetical protein